MKDKTSEAIRQIGHVIDLWMPMKIKYDKTPCVSIAIAHKGEVIYAKGFGYADIARRIKADEKTLYHIASHSKMFTAAAIMKLVETGKVRLDDYISDYIDWFKGKTKKSDASHITVRQILSHTAGIFRDGDTPHWVTGRFSRNLKKSFSTKSLTIENLTTFKYSNYGFSLLGLVIKKASGMAYEEYMMKNILRPLRMRNTYVDYVRGIKGMATGYGAEMPGQKRTAFEHYSTNAWAPATGFISNVIDMVRFISTFSLKNGSSALLNRESAKEMTLPRAKSGNDGEYGLGLDISYMDGRKIIGHGGGFNGFRTRTVLDTKSDIAVAVYTNSLSSNAHWITDGILDSTYKLLNDAGSYTNRRKIRPTKYEGIYRCVSDFKNGKARKLVEGSMPFRRIAI